MLLKIWQQWVDSGYSVQWCQDYFYSIQNNETNQEYL